MTTLFINKKKGKRFGWIRKREEGAFKYPNSFLVVWRALSSSFGKAQVEKREEPVSSCSTVVNFLQQLRPS